MMVKSDSSQLRFTSDISKSIGGQSREVHHAVPPAKANIAGEFRLLIDGVIWVTKVY